MPVATAERYVVASCHVERPLDDAVWTAFAALQRRRPGGVEIAALLRPPDPGAGELDEERWLARAREAALHGAIGHHTHWTSPSHARPVDARDAGERVRREARWLRERGIDARLFCGGGWYTDVGVAGACAAAGYADCTPRARRPAYLAAHAAWAKLTEPARIVLPDGAALVALPTTHSAGDAVRAAVRRALPARVHLYFHDTDLVDRRRRATVEAALRLVGARRPGRSLTEEAATVDLETRAWADVARGEATTPR
jgi:hypothetical protein